MEERNEQLFYTGTYASRQERGIYVCALRVTNGDLRIVGGVEGMEAFFSRSTPGWDEAVCCQ